MRHKIEIIPGLSKERILQSTPPKIYDRGEEYYENGAITEITRRGNEIDAMVEGSQYEPYHVKILFDNKGLNGCHCSCPYEDDFCKHIVATLLTCLIDPEKVEERETLAVGIEKLTKNELSELVELLVGNNFEAQRKVDFFLDDLERGQQVRKKRMQGSERKLADTAFYENEISQILYQAGRIRTPRISDVVDSLRGVIKRARDLATIGEGRSGIVVLRALTKVFIEEWISMEKPYNKADSFFYELDTTWSFVISKVDFMKAEKQSLLKEIKLWIEEVEDYGIEGAFKQAEYALDIDSNVFGKKRTKTYEVERILNF